MTSYLGSKMASGVYQAIIAAMPPHDTYIETHLGSGAILKNKPPAQKNIGIDIDPKAIEDLPAFSNTEIHNCDAVEFLKKFDFQSAGRVLIYSDPPYLHSTRTSNKRYRFEYTDSDHITLLEELKSLSEKNCYVMVSGYPSALYDSILSGWHSVEFQAMTRGGVRTEKLWFNFKESGAHWATFAGRNFTDRQRIKRKAERWASNYKKLPRSERVAVLAALLEIHRDPE